MLRLPSGHGRGCCTNPRSASQIQRVYVVSGKVSRYAADQFKVRRDDEVGREESGRLVAGAR